MFDRALYLNRSQEVRVVTGMTGADHTSTGPLPQLRHGHNRTSHERDQLLGEPARFGLVPRADRNRRDNLRPLDRDGAQLTPLHLERRPPRTSRQLTKASLNQFFDQRNAIHLGRDIEWTPCCKATRSSSRRLACGMLGSTKGTSVRSRKRMLAVFLRPVLEAALKTSTMFSCKTGNRSIPSSCNGLCRTCDVDTAVKQPL